jgi:hypothetical protein
VSLRYRPALGTQVQTISDARVTSVVFGLPSLPDSTVIESDWRTVQTARVLEVTAERLRLRLSLDSSRSRARIGPKRADVPMPGAEKLAIEAMVGPRLNFATATPVAKGADSSFVAALRARLGGLEFLLPEGPVPVGQSWDSPLQFPFGAYFTSGGRLSAAESVRGTATIAIDSVNVRGNDTLTFLSLAGTLEPKGVAVAGEGGVGIGAVNGRVAAALVWSSGWNAVVSGATNARFEVKLHLERSDGGPIDGSVSLTISGRHQVRW